MKTVTVAALLCAVMALTAAAGDWKPIRGRRQASAALAKVKEEQEALETPQEGEHQIAERSTSCPGGWRRISGRCFRYIPKPLTWAQAERNCQTMGANLASLHRAEEYHEIKRLIVDETHAYPETWIGGSDSAEEGTWLWSDGSPFRFHYWCRGEPSHGHSQQCALMNFGSDKCWDNRQCWYTYPSVCAKRM